MRCLLYLITLSALLALPSTMSAQDAIKPAVADPAAEYEALVFQAPSLPALPYRLLKPKDYDPQQKYPLVVFLHGAGERGSDNTRQLIHGSRNFADPALRKRYPAFFVLPQCPAEKKWVEVPWNLPKHEAPADPGETMQSLLALLESLQKEFSIDASRIYGAGLSMGGYGVWDILQRKPEIFAAAVPICGGGDPAYADKFKDTPVWAFHGDADPAVPVGRSREMIKAIEAAGGRPVYTEYEGVGHDSWTQTFNNRLVWDWLFAQRKH